MDHRMVQPRDIKAKLTERFQRGRKNSACCNLAVSESGAESAKIGPSYDTQNKRPPASWLPLLSTGPLETSMRMVIPRCCGCCATIFRSLARSMVAVWPCAALVPCTWTEWQYGPA